MYTPCAPAEGPSALRPPMSDTTRPVPAPTLARPEDRRLGPREGCLLEAAGYEGFRPLWPVTVLDLSAGGLRLTVPSLLPVGTHLLLSLRSAHGCPVLLGCRVVWARQDDG